MKEIDFTKLKINTPVWSIIYGWGKIIRSCSESNFVIKVNYTPSISKTYTEFGKTYTTDKLPSLFLNEFTIPDSAYKSPKIPMPEIVIGMVITTKENTYLVVDAGKEDLSCVNPDGWDDLSIIKRDKVIVKIETFSRQCLSVRRFIDLNLIWEA